MKINEVTYKWNGALSKRRSTTRIILHHAAASKCTAQQIHSWHLANGWVGIGYHFFVRKDGSVYRGRPENSVGAHAGNNNYDSIGICFEGNFMTETMPEAQKRAGQELVQYLKDKYGISTVQKHSDVNATGCPGTHFPFKEISEGTAEKKPAESAAEGFTAVFPQIAKGDKGDKVRVLQELLRGKGYDLGTYGADGDFGGATRSAVVALTSSGLWALVAKRADKNDAERRMLVGLAHDRIVHLGMVYVTRGYITQDEYENLNDYLYVPYEKMGGNGSAKRVMEEVRKLPIKRESVKA